MKVYLAGPINGCTDAEASDWRAEARRRIDHRVWVEDPMARDYRGEEHLNVSEIVEGDKAAIDECTHLLAYCTSPSVGTSMEIIYAAEIARIPVITVIPPGAPRSPWLLYHSTLVCSTLGEAASALLRESLQGSC